ncbi:acyltransferase family protein [Pyxidicoccus xibeiensis]|uniref:acyltransferase family protein n=1 Tax=Pyxidicoccus xibeiensis TaxID=2906759 RepID=UPI0020A81D38|nr:acyltransferase [Pyxidicoccus xibeiensis]MCP3142929.1 acyltransferase [Pyxidicoccus xibeiensis]
MHPNSARPDSAAAHGPRLGGHLPVLDGVRGLAVLLVVFFHTTHLSAGSAVGKATWWLAGAGWTGVDLFFVLSGFLITGILWEAKGQPYFFRNFYMRRFLRIFPLYYLTLAISFLVLPALAGRFNLDERITTEGAVWYLLYLSNFYQLWVDTTHPILGVVWSLAIEEQFYIVWPFLIAAVSYRGAIRLCLGTIALALAVRVGLALAGASIESTYVTTFSRVDSLALGGLLALALRHPEGLGLKAFPWMRWGVYAAVPLVLVMVVMPVGPLYELVKRTGGYTAIAIVYAAGVYKAVAVAPGHPLHRFLSSKLLRTYGKYSYAIYLIHSPLDAILRRTVLKLPLQTVGGTDIPMQLLFYVVAAGLSLGLALVSWNLFEKHLLKLKDYFPYGEQRPPVPAPAPLAGGSPGAAS